MCRALNPAKNTSRMPRRSKKDCNCSSTTFSKILERNRSYEIGQKVREDRGVQIGFIWAVIVLLHAWKLLGQDLKQQTSLMGPKRERESTLLIWRNPLPDVGFHVGLDFNRLCGTLCYRVAIGQIMQNLSFEEVGCLSSARSWNKHSLTDPMTKTFQGERVSGAALAGHKVRPLSVLFF